jgi:hypothetical protein
VTELLAGAFVAVAALAYVLEPLGRSSEIRTAAEPPDPGVVETLVRQMRQRLAPRCPECGSVAGAGAAFCGECGRVLLSRDV